MTSPHEWYDSARRIKRRIIFHTGPTNSGKTYSALEALAKAKSGVYLGPLRLMASEVYEKLNERGVPTTLVTGQELVETEGARHVACTVEMCPLGDAFDCAVRLTPTPS